MASIGAWRGPRETSLESCVLGGGDGRIVDEISRARADLAGVEIERVEKGPARRRIGTDVALEEPSLSILHADVGVAQVHLAVATRLHLRALEPDTGLDGNTLGAHVDRTGGPPR